MFKFENTVNWTVLNGLPWECSGNAEKAKTALDGKVLKNRTLKVRFAAHGAALRLKNLSPWVSNELLERAFNVFGEVSVAQLYNN